MTEIENPYVQATVENFRRTPSNLRLELLERLAREMNGTGANQSDSADSPASFRRIPCEDRTEEFQWLAENSSMYQGEWVALRGKQLLAHSMNYDEVSRTAKALGEVDVMYLFIEDEESEDFVRFLS